MTTEEEIAVLERAARLECEYCAGGQLAIKYLSHETTKHLYVHSPVNWLTCHAPHIRAEIDRLRRTLEPPSAEEWANKVRAYRQDVYPITRRSEIPSLQAVFDLLDRWDRGKGVE